MSQAARINSNPSSSKDILERLSQKEIIRFCTAGSVDDGKSTLIGRLLYDTNNIFEDHLQSMKEKSKGDASRVFSILTDGLKAEQEQGITIDVAYRYFSTGNRRFVLADAPGHEQYTRNMVTAASDAHAMLLLIDATKGVLSQTKRHAFVASLVKVPSVVVAINKMDLVNFSQSRFEEIKNDFLDANSTLGIDSVFFVPVAALTGENIAKRSEKTPWYVGNTILGYLEDIRTSLQTKKPFRMFVQTVIRPGDGFRGLAGTIQAGTVSVGDTLIALPAQKEAVVKNIYIPGRGVSVEEKESASADEAIIITLDREIDSSSGTLLCSSSSPSKVISEFESKLIWFDEDSSLSTQEYIFKVGSLETRASITAIKSVIDVHTLDNVNKPSLVLNDIAHVTIATTQRIPLDLYSDCKSLGCFILIHPRTLHTVAGGIISDFAAPEFDRRANRDKGLIKSQNLHSESSQVSKRERLARSAVAPRTLWCTGLSGSGKSTIASALERELFNRDVLVYKLDGDNLRSGINRDLGFSEEDRRENIRRTAEVAKLFNDAGITVICSLISPREDDREMAKNIIGPELFLEIHLSTPLEVCEERDPHGLYKKARKGEISGFTGVSSVYEKPRNPACSLDTSKKSVQECISALLVLFPEFQ